VQIQQAVVKLTETCWDKCIKGPEELSAAEAQCMQSCSARFLDASALVMRELTEKNTDLK